jgi:hypothetical protein
VREFEFRQLKNVAQAKRISEKIAQEWLRIANRYGRKMNRKQLNLRLVAEYEAEQQIVFCLMWSLNAKVLDFLTGFL